MNPWQGFPEIPTRDCSKHAQDADATGLRLHRGSLHGPVCLFDLGSRDSELRTFLLYPIECLGLNICGVAT